MGILIKTQQEIARMREGGRMLAMIVGELQEMVSPGVGTGQLEEHFNKRLQELGAATAFRGYRNAPGVPPFPSSICTCINAEIVHAPAVPSRMLKEGDLLSIDAGLLFPKEGGFYVDMAITVPVGTVEPRLLKLIEVARGSCEQTIAELTRHSTVRDISRAVQRIVESNGFSVVRDFVGHGIGRKLHEDPQIPNYVDRRFPDYPLADGMCLAIEPMIAIGSGTAEVLEDGWTAVTIDRSISAHWEYTVVVTKDRLEILTQC